ncbi:MAG: autotransporter outer membrane beta-barrel domain-containing protein [Polyangiaceae bacterium]|jgi:serine/threonine-protein kinase|nr:autotransporter outer membrane beta-barrel domain-containing protein [Polyangiaceae bacterium]
MIRRLAFALTLCLLPRGVRADTAADKALAEVLFEEGRKLTAEGKHEEACPKFAESQKRDPGIGTMLYLANCYEKVGKLASAWALYREAAQRAGGAGQTEREKIAVQRAAAIEGQIPRLTVQVSQEARVPGFEVLLDGAPLPDALWGVPMPMDSGKHLIEARAPGKHPWRLELTQEQGARQSLTVPALASANEPVPAPASMPVLPPAPAPAAPAPAPPPADGPREQPAASRPAAGLAPTLALRLGGALPLGKTGAAAGGTSQQLSSLVTAGPGIEVNGGAQIGAHGAVFLFYARHFFGASSELQATARSSYRQAAGIGAQWATSQGLQGPVGFFGEAGLVLLDQLSLSTTSPAGEPPCSSDARLSGAGVRLGAGIHIPVASRLLLSPLVNAEVGRFSSASVTGDAGCRRGSGSYSLPSKDLHATLFAGLSLSLPLELH